MDEIGKVKWAAASLSFDHLFVMLAVFVLYLRTGNGLLLAVLFIAGTAMKYAAKLWFEKKERG